MSRVGNKRHLVTIEEFVKSQDTMGGKVESWNEFSKAWSSILPLRGNEKYYSNEKHATATHSVIVRYIGGVSPKMRLVYGARIFEIVSVLNIGERNKELILVVQEEDL